MPLLQNFEQSEIKSEKMRWRCEDIKLPTRTRERDARHSIKDALLGDGYTVTDRFVYKF